MSVQPNPADVEAQVERIISSQSFQRSEKLCRFLRFVVREALAGRGADLKEYLIGVEVFEKGAGFDPRLDSAVRVDARRLRTKLAEYYAAEGASDRIRIHLPKGGYVPQFTAEAPPDTVPVRQTRTPLYAGLAVLILVAAVAAFWFGRSTADSPPGAIQSLAVLPFENLTGNAANGALCDGLTEELIDRLARLGRVHIASRTSSFAYRGKRAGARQIARELKVDALVEGSIREGDGVYRIAVQLIRAGDGMHIWSDSFDTPKQDGLQVQAGAGKTIEQRLLASLPDDSVYTVEWKSKPSQADRLVTQAAYLAQRRSQASLVRAIEYARQAIQEDPQFAPAYAVLADSALALADMRPQDAANLLKTAHQEAERAIKLDPGLAGPHSTLGTLKLDYERDWEGARELYKKALSLNSRHSQTHARYARLLTLTGRHDEAIAEARQAELLAPLSASAIAVVGQAAYYARRYEEALAHLRRCLEIDPAFDNARTTSARIYGILGRHDEALRMVMEMSEATRERGETAALLVWIHALRGNRSEAEKWLDKAQSATSIARAAAYSSIGENDRAIAALDEAVRKREANVVYVKASPVLDPLRRDPRIEHVCRAIGLSGCVRN